MTLYRTETRILYVNYFSQSKRSNPPSPSFMEIGLLVRTIWACSFCVSQFQGLIEHLTAMVSLAPNAPTTFSWASGTIPTMIYHYSFQRFVILAE